MHSPDNRPVFLDLRRIKLPLTGIISILHRVSGVFLFLSLPFLLYWLHLSLLSESDYQQALEWRSNPFMVVVLLLICASIAHHLVAGIRFLLLDIEIGVDKLTARKSAKIAVVADILVFLFLIQVIWL